MSRRIDLTLNGATQRLIESYPQRNEQSDTARLDAQILLCHVLQKDNSYLFTWPDKELTEPQLEAFHQLIEQRAQGTPVAYLTGERDFWSLKLKVNPSVLIPRPDTEHLVEIALNQQLPENALVADLGTGSGAIALSLAKENRNWRVMTVDRFPEPLATAEENAQLNQIANVEFLLGSWCEPLPDNMDMIVSNPPYIREDDEHLNQGDVQFEPITALTAGADGLDDIRLISAQAFQKLKQGGWLLLEHGFDQGRDIRSILTEDGLIDARTEQDLAGHDRVTLARRP
ncbi:peptide chain release factor N(5)-glutamine methyltransferase [Endozoicomonas sp. OPT23]|uniref:peptide chain release factor N(5)-glutamine methyltransferase n=1 Tax=Endozoicomonas sp. OPT23 TaxID=2072845 RepID=UPI00129A4F39|nr:peptide chain release factor N(5)-glutamine methyltransferase [Endozoicomonas sp. OPT23]MRI32203.1 peptide chain release factor N(5)-glutamine methyltransferase [Endozoicomonas sp. OPT23]